MGAILAYFCPNFVAMATSLLPWNCRQHIWVHRPKKPYHTHCYACLNVWYLYHCWYMQFFQFLRKIVKIVKIILPVIKCQLSIRVEGDTSIDLLTMFLRWTMRCGLEILCSFWLFTALHRMQTQSSNENSVHLFLHPSVKRVNCDKVEEKSVQIFVPYERSYSLVFWEKEWLVGVTSSTWNFGSTGPCWSEIANFEPIIARSASVVTPTPRKRSINTNRKSTTHFPMSPTWTS